MVIKFSEFDVAHGCWENYITRFAFCLEANEVTEDTKKKANLLAVCGPDLFDLISSLIAPKKISEVTFSTIKTYLDGHFHPPLNEIVESFKFHSRSQEEGEKVRDYIANLRKLSIHCNFTDIERTLRDRLVCGIRDKEVQRKMLQQTKLTFKSACDMALSHESANSDASLIVVPGMSKANITLEEPMEVNKISYKKNELKFNKPQSKPECFRCGKLHKGECRFRWTKCNFCGKTGHIEVVCLSKNKEKGSVLKSDCNGLYEASINNIRQKRVPAFLITMFINNFELEMEIDSGCAFTLISEPTARLIWKGKLPEMKKNDLALKTWTDSALHILGKVMVEVRYKGSTKNLPLIVAKGQGPSLIGRNWFDDLNIQLLGINNIKIDTIDSSNVLGKYKGVFEEGLGKYKGPVVSITLKEGATPKFLKCRSIPFAIRERVFNEIDRLVSEHVLEPVAHAEWATPIVPVLKPNGSVRLCGDYRSTVNMVTDTDTYPLPTLDEAFTQLQGGVIFSKIDLERAYTQVTVDEPTSLLLTLNTPKGLYKVKRLPFGVKACPGIFQRLMSSLLANIPGVAVLLDDIVVSGTDIKEHNARLNAVLKQLQEAGLRVNKNKCKFAATTIHFLGFVIDEIGIHPCEHKINEIKEFPAPGNIKELQAFLGLLNFYDRFLPYKATIAEPLYKLLNKNTKWQWKPIHQTAFNKLQKMLTSSDTLVHYDLKKKIILSCDASQYGLGAVLEHVMEDGSIRPIMFASKTMNTHERNYAQVDKEAAAIVFGLKKFHQFVSGRKVTIKTDHKPLLGLFDPKRPIPNIISPRMLRWALLLSSYDYTLEYVKGTNLGNADALSRLPSPNTEKVEEEFSGVLLIEETPLELEFSAEEVARLTLKDTKLCKILYWIKNGWPNKTENEFKVYWQKREEFSTFRNCILWGNRVVLPEKMWAKVLEELHTTHDGIVITKAMARSYFWWPAIDKQIEDMIRQCHICAENRSMPTKVTHHWIRPNKPWSRLHIDYVGPFQGKTFLILIDSFSKWPEVKIVVDMSSSTLIKILREIFAAQGLPDTIVSDNGRSFTSEEFQNYCKTNGIRHILVAPYHPASNGQAERTVQTIKNKLRKLSNVPWQIRLPKILYGLRTTPNSINEKTPAELLNNRRFRTKFDYLNPLSSKDNPQLKELEDNENTKVRNFEIGQTVYIKNYTGEPRWLKGVVDKKIGVCRYLVKWNGKLLKRHINQIHNFGGGKEELERKMLQQRNKTQETVDEDDEDDVLLPSPSKWADIIGVTGPQDIEIQRTPEVCRTKGNKRALSESPPQSINKKIACNTEEDEIGKEEEQEVSQQSFVVKDSDSDSN
nr:uncharacterized protein K02A2.6-like [Plodia interpunctella]